MNTLKQSVVILSFFASANLFAATMSPVFVPQKIVSGRNHTCVLATNGSIKCWGETLDGQLGSASKVKYGKLPDTMGPNLPTVNFGKDLYAKDMCASLYSTCAVTTTGGVKCWGYNYYGQLGQETSRNHIGDETNDMRDNLAWTNLGSDFMATQITCGYDHVCALNTKGQVKCWGDNTNHQLGYSTGDRKSIGSKVGDMGDKLPYLPLPPVKFLSTGYAHSCAATEKNMYCWGSNISGELGLAIAIPDLELPKDGTNDFFKVKLEDPGIETSIVAIRSGYSATCAIYKLVYSGAQKVKCWGNNGLGLLGLGSDAPAVGRESDSMGSKLPEPLINTASVVQIETHGNTTCVLHRNGAVQCWGNNLDGQLGTGDALGRGKSSEDMGKNLAPIALSLPVLSIAQSSSSESNCAILINHEIKCWGYGGEGELGYEDSLSRGTRPSDMGDNLPFVRYN